MATPLRSVRPCDSAEMRYDARVAVNAERRAARGPEPCRVNSCSLGLNMSKLLTRASASPSSSSPSAPCSSTSATS
eukprot:9374717-Pyramimonas_sp.AAC.1